MIVVMSVSLVKQGGEHGAAISDLFFSARFTTLIQTASAVER
jgi:hypothetical protein